MNEKPIIFKPEMVKAILDGRKTQMRRVVKHIPALGSPEQWCHLVQRDKARLFHIAGDYRKFCPYGTVGDRLWVREAWSLESLCGYSEQDRERSNYQVLYRAGGFIELEHEGMRGSDPYVKTYDSQRGKWRPSIHMPRWASRLTLEITDVRVERVQDISGEDAEAEGAKEWALSSGVELVLREQRLDIYQLAFSYLWNSIHGNDGYGWDANPFCWVISFTAMKGEA